MHNCKSSKDELMEMASQGWMPEPNALTDCPRCGEELAALSAAARLAGDAMQLAQPGEEYWAGYNARLRARLSADSRPAGRKMRRLPLASWLRRFATASVRIPAPVAVAILGFVVGGIFFGLYSAAKLAGAPTIVAPPARERIVEVPVIQEKVITRDVYRERPALSSQSAPRLPAVSVAAAKRREAEAPQPESLDGFKPVQEARLTLIKGSRDEK